MLRPEGVWNVWCADVVPEVGEGLWPSPAGILESPGGGYSIAHPGGGVKGAPELMGAHDPSHPASPEKPEMAGRLTARSPPLVAAHELGLPQHMHVAHLS